MRAFITTLTLGLGAAVSGCGDTTGEQVLIGGGAGALGAILLDANPVTGVAVGVAGNLIYCKENPHRC
ncbi:hypothetical protein [Pseudophaeobacter sp.]|uniref:hypothetical protein n=1 Tax=Pseudophaeobacter sp. TaxID=1971739 RepID=UPI00405993B5